MNTMVFWSGAPLCSTRGIFKSYRLPNYAQHPVVLVDYFQWTLPEHTFVIAALFFVKYILEMIKYYADSFVFVLIPLKQSTKENRIRNIRKKIRLENKIHQS